MWYDRLLLLQRITLDIGIIIPSCQVLNIPSLSHAFLITYYENVLAYFQLTFKWHTSLSLRILPRDVTKIS